MAKYRHPKREQPNRPGACLIEQGTGFNLPPGPAVQNKAHKFVLNHLAIVVPEAMNVHYVSLCERCVVADEMRTRRLI